VQGRARVRSPLPSGPVFPPPPSGARRVGPAPSSDDAIRDSTGPGLRRTSEPVRTTFLEPVQKVRFLTPLNRGGDTDCFRGMPEALFPKLIQSKSAPVSPNRRDAHNTIRTRRKFQSRPGSPSRISGNSKQSALILPWLMSIRAGSLPHS